MRLQIRHFFRLVSTGGCIALGVYLFAGCGQSSDSASAWNVRVGDKVPEFSLKDTEGNVFSSASLLGKPYAIAVFATWCPPCKQELTALETQAWQPLQDKDVKVLGINFGEEDAGTIADFKTKIGLTFPLLVDEAGAYRKTLGVNMIPQSLVVNSQGVITQLHEGFTEESVKNIGEELLSDSKH